MRPMSFFFFLSFSVALPQIRLIASGSFFCDRPSFDPSPHPKSFLLGETMFINSLPIRIGATDKSLSLGGADRLPP